jgi:hypothetical protein
MMIGKTPMKMNKKKKKKKLSQHQELLTNIKLPEKLLIPSYKKLFKNVNQEQALLKFAHTEIQKLKLNYQKFTLKKINVKKVLDFQHLFLSITLLDIIPL